MDEDLTSIYVQFQNIAHEEWDKSQSGIEHEFIELYTYIFGYDKNITCKQLPIIIVVSKRCFLQPSMRQMCNSFRAQHGVDTWHLTNIDNKKYFNVDHK